MRACVRVCVYMYVWKLESNYGCHFLSDAHLFFKTGSLLAWNYPNRLGLACQRVLGVEFRSLWSQGMSSACLTISPTPQHRLSKSSWGIFLDSFFLISMTLGEWASAVFFLPVISVLTGVCHWVTFWAFISFIKWRGWTHGLWGPFPLEVPLNEWITRVCVHTVLISYTALLNYV